MSSTWTVAGRSRDKEKKPTGWIIQGERLTISLTCAHIDYPGEWVMHCHTLGVSSKVLSSAGLPEAKAEALAVIDNCLRILVRDVSVFSLAD
jgi:hypothetical protein